MSKGKDEVCEAEKGIGMLEIFQQEKTITIVMLTFWGISILTRLLLGGIYQNMIKETDNMTATENRLLKQCKVKFANCYQLNNGVANIAVFVDKFLNRLSFGPVSFGTLYHLSGQAMLLSVVSAGVAICKCIMDGRMLGEILPFYIASFLELYLYFSVSTVVDVKQKRQILKTNLMDYLENHLSARIDVTERDMEMLYGERRYRGKGKRGQLEHNYERRTVELMPIGGRIAAAGEEDFLLEEEKDSVLKEDMEAATRREMERRVTEEELEALLKEFLTV